MIYSSCHLGQMCPETKAHRKLCVFLFLNFTKKDHKMSDDIIIDAVSPRVRYVADGTTTAFSFVFPIFSEQDMNVYIDDTLIKSG